MTADKVQDLSQLVGKEVRTLCAWAGVKVGTIGVVDEIYDNDQAIVICWSPESDNPELKHMWRVYKRLIRDIIPPGVNAIEATVNGQTIRRMLIRDGFRGEKELRFLEIIE